MQKQRKSLLATSRQRNGLCPMMTFYRLAVKHQHNDAQCPMMNFCRLALKHQHRREKLLEVGADSPDGRANFAKRVVIKHFH